MRALILARKTVKFEKKYKNMQKISEYLDVEKNLKKLLKLHKTANHMTAKHGF